MRPLHERLWTLPCGAAGLTDAELLEVLFGREEDALPKLETLLHELGGLERLVMASPDELCRLGISSRSIERLVVAREMICRALTPRAKGMEIQGPEQVQALLHPRLALVEQECFVVLCLDRAHRVMRVDTVTMGTATYTVVDPSVVYRLALRLGAAGIIVAHNHPSGDATPSPQDIEITRKLAEAGRVLGIPLLDHVVVARGGFTSLADRGLVVGIRC